MEMSDERRGINGDDGENRGDAIVDDGRLGFRSQYTSHFSS